VPNSGPIYAENVQGLAELDATNFERFDGISNQPGITDLAGIQCLVSLTELDLSYNTISDLSPLSSLTSLTHLTARGNIISDLSPLSSLTSLDELNLVVNEISDLSPLSSLSELTHLALYDNDVSDLSPLSSLTSLRQLGLPNNAIGDLSPLVENEGLGEGDSLFLADQDPPLDCAAQRGNIDTLELRGVIVSLGDC